MRTHWAAHMALVSSLSARKPERPPPADDFEHGFGDESAVALAPFRVFLEGGGQRVIEHLVLLEHGFGDAGGGFGEDAVHFHGGGTFLKSDAMATNDQLGSPALAECQGRVYESPRMDFQLVSDYQPEGDQAQAIAKLAKSLAAGNRHQTLLGVTGSGKTFTMANLIAAPRQADADHEPQQDARGAALLGVQELLPAQRGGVFRLLLRLLSAGSLHPAQRHLHREGFVHQRGDRAAAAQHHGLAADTRRTRSWWPPFPASTAWARRRITRT